jgi:poly(beta-D-mannuronate) lyase
VRSRSALLCAALAGVVLAVTAAATARAAEHEVSDPSAFQDAISVARPGDIIRIAAGTHDSWMLAVPETASGTAEARIRIVPVEPGATTFTGQSGIEIAGSYIEVAGFRFDHTGQDSVVVTGSHNRIGELVFQDAGDKQSTVPGIVVIEPGATDNEIDHCEFYGSTSMSIKVRVRDDEPVPTGTHIHHNLFQDISRLSKNGQEAIQLGQGEGSALTLGAVVEFNRFVRVDGDAELVSNKSSGNVISHNFALDSNGELVLRTGRDCLVEGNVLLNTRGGVRISGSGHRVINNFISTTKGRGIVLTDGTSRYQPAKDNLIAHNTVVSAGRGLMFAMMGSGFKEAAAGNRIVNNLFVTVSQRSPIEATHAEDLPDRLAQNAFAANLLWWQKKQGARATAALGDGFRIADPSLRTDGEVPGLGAGSPAIDAGVPGYADVDIRGRKRPQGGAPDVGAFEAP